jgi:PTS system nitrogen regulatory IIA component
MAGDDFHPPTVDLQGPATVSPEAAVRFLVQQLVQRSQLRSEDAEHVVDQILHRESLGSTDLGNGIAVPHCKSDVVDRLVGIVGLCRDGMAWRGVGQDPVHVVCLLVTSAAHPADGLQSLAAIAHRLREKSMRDPPGPAV